MFKVQVDNAVQAGMLRQALFARRLSFDRACFVGGSATTEALSMRQCLSTPNPLSLTLAAWALVEKGFALHQVPEKKAAVLVLHWAKVLASRDPETAEALARVKTLEMLDSMPLDFEMQLRLSRQVKLD